MPHWLAATWAPTGLSLRVGGRAPLLGSRWLPAERGSHPLLVSPADLSSCPGGEKGAPASRDGVLEPPLAALVRSRERGVEAGERCADVVYRLPTCQRDLPECLLVCWQYRHQGFKTKTKALSLSHPVW